MRCRWALAAAAAVAAASAQRVKPLLPSPVDDWQACGQRAASYICDPQGYLARGSVGYDGVAKEIEVARTAALEAVRCGGGGKGGMEVGVAVMRNMGTGLDPFEESNDGAIRAVAETVARTMHDDWGVGDPGCGDNGVLVFLSIEDRAIYISRGAALDATLSSRRIDRVVNDMKPFCKGRDYSGAVSHAVRQLLGFVEVGPPTWKEWAWGIFLDSLPAVFFFGIVAWAFVSAGRQARHRAEYAAAQAQLNQLDRERAEALAGRYQQTSCPICLEAFQDAPAPGDTSTAGDGNEGDASTSTVAGDGDEGDAKVDDEDEDGAAPSPRPFVPKVGSDGRPVKLLRCGHCFDQSCFDAWVETNPDAAMRCPICRESTAGDDDDPRPSDRAARPGARRRRPPGSGGGCSSTRSTPEQRWAFYHPEMAFRLRRVQRRWPGFVHHADVERWQQRDYRGRFAEDQAFTCHAPPPPSSTRGGSSYGGGGRSFGGGRSSGGGGGRW